MDIVGLEPRSRQVSVDTPMRRQSVAVTAIQEHADRSCKLRTSSGATPRTYRPTVRSRRHGGVSCQRRGAAWVDRGRFSLSDGGLTARLTNPVDDAPSRGWQGAIERTRRREG